MASAGGMPRASKLLGKRKVSAKAMKKAVREVVLSHYGSLAPETNGVTKKTAGKSAAPNAVSLKSLESKEIRPTTRKKAVVGKV